MKSERAVRRALKRWERQPHQAHDSYYKAWTAALAWVLEFGGDPTLKQDNEAVHSD